MTTNPKDVVLPEKSKMDAIKKVTMHFLNNGIWKPTTTRIYNDTIQKATTPDDIILALARPYRLCAVNFFFFNMSRDDLSTALSNAWTSSENPNMDSSMTKAQAVRLSRTSELLQWRNAVIVLCDIRIENSAVMLCHLKGGMA